MYAPNRSYGENPVLSEIRQRKRLILIGQSLNIFFSIAIL